MTPGPFSDRELSLEILSMAIWSRAWLRQTGHLIDKEDFKPLAAKDSLAYVLAGMALDFYQTYREPLGSAVDLEIAKWCRSVKVGDGKRRDFEEFVDTLRRRYYKPERLQLLQDAVVSFKKERKRKFALRSLIELGEAGELCDDEKWLSIMRGALDGFYQHRSTDWLDGLQERTVRRIGNSHRKIPILMIDPLDTMVRAIGRGQLGMLFAAYKAGKSLALIWIAISYLLQGFDTLFFTLEDPQEEVEDRFDACMAHLPLDSLPWEGPQLEKRGERFMNLINKRLHIVDGTEAGLSVGAIEGQWERERTMGFDAQVVIVDYDDEIVPPRRQTDRRQEFADIYRELRRFVARNDLFGWTAAQCKRESIGKVIIGGDMLAEDISKIRKVAMAIGIGEGEWGEDSKFLWIAAHKFDRHLIGCNIFSDLPRALFYDQERTLRYIRQERESRRPQ